MLSVLLPLFEIGVALTAMMIGHWIAVDPDLWVSHVNLPPPIVQASMYVTACAVSGMGAYLIIRSFRKHRPHAAIVIIGAVVFLLCIGNSMILAVLSAKALMVNDGVLRARGVQTADLGFIKPGTDMGQVCIELRYRHIVNVRDNVRRYWATSGGYYYIIWNDHYRVVDVRHGQDYRTSVSILGKQGGT